MIIWLIDCLIDWKSCLSHPLKGKWWLLVRRKQFEDVPLGSEFVMYPSIVFYYFIDKMISQLIKKIIGRLLDKVNHF